MPAGLVPAGLEAGTRAYPSVIHIGDTVTMAVTARPGEGVETPRPGPRVGVFDVLGVARGDSAGAARIRIYVTSFETGEQVLPSIAIPVRTGGRVDSLRTPAYRISVESLLPQDTTKVASLSLRDARAPVDIPRHFLWGVFFGYVLVLAALAGLGWVLYRKLTRKPADLPVFTSKAPPRPAEQVALEALDAIAARGYVVRGLYKQHYTEVMDVLRSYIEGRFGIEALDRTSWELLQALAVTSLDPPHRAELELLLSEADLVKFAKYTPQPDTAQRLLDDARQWVKDTTPVVAPAPAKSGSGTSGNGPSPVSTGPPAVSEVS